MTDFPYFTGGGGATGWATDGATGALLLELAAGWKTVDVPVAFGR